MKGKTTIQLFNKHGQRVLKKEKTNLITNMFKTYWEENLNKALYVDLFRDVLGNNPNAMMPNPMLLSNGLMLSGNEQAEDANNWLPEGLPLGYAGAAYSGTDTKRGTLNETETGAITNGYNWVWDFATDKANGLIKAVSLCPQAGGNGSPFGEICTVNSFSANISRGVFDKDMTKYTRYATGGVGYTKSVLNKIQYDSVIGTTDTSYLLTGYDQDSTPITYKDKVWVIARLTADNKYYLLKTDGEGTVESAWDLSSKITSPSYLTSGCFGMIDNKMVYISSWSNPYMTFFVYDTDISAFEADREYDITANGTSAKYAYANTTETWIDDYGNEMLWINSPSSSSSSYTWSILLDKSFNNWCINGYTPYAYRYSYTMINPGSPCFAIRYSSSYTYLYLRMLTIAMFSINNLDSPYIEKTSDYTMKVTYQLTW